MSTKTTFKRIALVAVASLGLGVLSSVPSSAGVATAFKINDTTTYGFVGETISAAISLTVTAPSALSGTSGSADSITVTAATLSAPTNAAALSQQNSSAGATNFSAGQWGLVDTAPANKWTRSSSSTKFTLTASGDEDTNTASNVGYVNFNPVTPGTYKFTVSVDSATAALATAPATYSAGVVTVVVLSAGTASGDGAIETPFNAIGGVAGAGNYNQVKVTGQKGSSALGTRVVVTGSTFEAAVAGGTLSTDKTVLVIPGVATGSNINQANVNVLTPAVGTVTVSTYLETAVGTYSTTASNTVTITVRAKALTGPYSYNEAYMSTAAATVPTDVTDAAIVTTPIVTAATPVANTAVARIQVIQYDALENTADTSMTQAVTAEIATAGRIGTLSTGTDATSYVAVPAGNAVTTQSATSDFYVFNDGRSGSAVVTVKVGGVVAFTRTISFTGTATQLKLVASTATAPNPSKSYIPVAGTSTISVLPYDANNVKMSAVTVYATSDTPSVASVASTSFSGGVVTVTGVAVGKTNINICIGSCATATVKMVVPVEVTKSTGIAKLALDKTSAQPGEKVTWTITVTDVNGRPVADNSNVAIYSAVSGNMTLSGGALPTGTETFTAGVATGYFYAPSAGSGTLTITATQGTSHDTYIAGLKAATAAGTTYTALKDVVELTVANAAADAAAAAAEEATAAANDATDAALSAAEAAEAATAMAQEAVDAVAELSASVTKLISALRAQITTLTNLVVKIQKKVKA